MTPSTLTMAGPDTPHQDSTATFSPVATVSGTLDAARRSIRFLTFSGSPRGPTTDLDNGPSPPYQEQDPREPQPSVQGEEPQVGAHSLVPRGSIRRNIDLGTSVLSKTNTEKQLFTLEEDKPKKQGSLVTIFAIWNTMMGSSLLIMPWAIAQAGYVLGIGLTIFLGCLSYYTCGLVLKTSEKDGESGDEEKVVKPEFSDFGDAIEYFLGRRLSLFGIIISLLTFLGALVAYWIFMSRFLFNVGNVIHHYAWDNNQTTINHRQILENLDDEPPGTGVKSVSSFHRYWSAEYTVPAYLILILYPISCMKEPTVFTKFNALGVGSVLILIGYVIYRAALWGVNMDHFKDPSIVGFNTKFPAITGSLSMGFFIHNGILPITAHHAKPANKKRDLGIAYLLVALTYLTIGIIYYITYPDRKDGIPDNFLRLVTKDDIYGIISSVFLLFQMVTVYPLLLFMFRNQFMTKILHIANYRYAWIFVLNAVVVLICVLLAMFWPRVGALIRIVGAISGFVYNYTFPCLVYLAALRASGRLTKFNLLIHSAIVVFGVLNLIGQFVIPLD
ncbi:hypothetical protein RvY_04686-2 [Ramazzottius varieornatus]|uniref:Amino acid transporter transmembrane domain-containing protein n=1 Tax=Ramazzottius varieornatus TaxID=947166 RepID=A0A1D1UT39_RAMVA|nr:hypothetical protein RvY_04686-2 [Ramazzottius varieornatus]